MVIRGPLGLIHLESQRKVQSKRIDVLFGQVAIHDDE